MVASKDDKFQMFNLTSATLAHLTVKGESAGWDGCAWRESVTRQVTVAVEEQNGAALAITGWLP
ncbi:hypothetical protein HPB48_006857 [Haemaphysalis longicornis]|uniref:Uncharacterized protein n=1 Tax=Haemaphysalis longicornis TaxID=44386 RepID=A0A9J6FEZ3_HAELO|nr:hypothetical protein HPB48_006857 [Haemaphysalis longicornis]